MIRVCLSLVENIFLLFICSFLLTSALSGIPETFNRLFSSVTAVVSLLAQNISDTVERP